MAGCEDVNDAERLSPTFRLFGSRRLGMPKRKLSLKAVAVLAVPTLSGAVLLALLAMFYYDSKPIPEAPPPVGVDLHALGGAGTETEVPRRELLLRLDLAGLSVRQVYTVELDDALGVKVLEDGVGAQNSTATLKVPRLPPGVYFVRVTAPSGELLREYGIRVMHHR